MEFSTWYYQSMNASETVGDVRYSFLASSPTRKRFHNSGTDFGFDKHYCQLFNVSGGIRYTVMQIPVAETQVGFRLISAFVTIHPPVLNLRNHRNNQSCAQCGKSESSMIPGETLDDGRMDTVCVNANYEILGVYIFLQLCDLIVTHFSITLGRQVMYFINAI